jgi:hypothetical protein
MGTAANVDALTGYIVAFAPLGTTLPASAFSTLSGTWREVGFIGEDGIPEVNSSDVTEIKDAAGNVVRKIQTQHDLTYAFTPLETNDNVIELFYGNGDDDAWEITGDELPNLAFVIEVEDGHKTTRICIPNGQVTERGEVPHTNASATQYPMTITCYPDSNGVKAYVYRETHLTS